MLPRLTHRQIEAFRAVMEIGKVTAAAAAAVLGTTQPSVSKLIAKLERAAGFEMFERQGKQVAPTSEAHALYEEVERAFVGMMEVSRITQYMRDFRTGSLLIAGMPALALKLLSDVPTVDANCYRASTRQFEMANRALRFFAPPFLKTLS